MNIAARQRALAERYVSDVLLVTNGFAADPGDAAEDLRENAALLLGGGTGVSVHGADAEIDIEPASDPRVVAKLEQDQRLIEELIGIGEDCWPSSPAIRGSTTWCWTCASPARSSPPCRTTPSER